MCYAVILSSCEDLAGREKATARKIITAHVPRAGPLTLADIVESMDPRAPASLRPAQRSAPFFSTNARSWIARGATSLRI